MKTAQGLHTQLLFRNLYIRYEQCSFKTMNVVKTEKYAFNSVERATSVRRSCCNTNTESVAERVIVWKYVILYSTLAAFQVVLQMRKQNRNHRYESQKCQLSFANLFLNFWTLKITRHVFLYCEDALKTLYCLYRQIIWWCPKHYFLTCSCNCKKSSTAALHIDNDYKLFSLLVKRVTWKHNKKYSSKSNEYL